MLTENGKEISTVKTELLVQWMISHKIYQKLNRVGGHLIVNKCKDGAFATNNA